MLKEMLFRGLKRGISIVSKNSPIVLAAVGVAGFVGATVVACKSTPKVNLVLQEEEEEKGKRLTKKEEFKVRAKVYLPTILLILASAMCIGASTYISTKRNIALGTALIAGEKALKEYKQTVEEEFGKDKAEQIEDKIIEKRMTENPPTIAKIVETGEGNILFYEPLSNQYFHSRKEAIEKAVNTVNAQLIDSEWVYANEFYDYLKIENIGFGEDQGWVYDFSGVLSVSFVPSESPWGEPMFAVKLNEKPIYDNRWC